MAPIPSSYGKGPSCDLVVEAGSQATSVRIALRSGATPVEPRNLLFILSDEHQRDIAGCYGDRIAITPNIDAPRGARRPLHQRLHALPDLRAGARRARDRAMGAPDQGVGQRRPLSRRAAELAPPAARATAIASSRSASCISARPPTTTASARRSCRCTCSTATAT